jgi:hypothetical protein
MCLFVPSLYFKLGVHALDCGVTVTVVRKNGLRVVFEVPEGGARDLMVARKDLQSLTLEWSDGNSYSLAQPYMHIVDGERIVVSKRSENAAVQAVGDTVRRLGLTSHTFHVLGTPVEAN